jgi:hypothetical protein
LLGYYDFVGSNFFYTSNNFFLDLTASNYRDYFGLMVFVEIALFGRPFNTLVNASAEDLIIKYINVLKQTIGRRRHARLESGQRKKAIITDKNR